MKGRVLFLVGPTGSGKTELSLQLARRLDAEIISADSMQVYRGMDIGTAKPSRAKRRRIPHHLIDLISPRTNFSTFQYRRYALKAIERILRKGRIPLIVGGSGLYIETLWKGISDQPKASTELRKQLEKEAVEKGLHFLHAKLWKMDPLRAQAIHLNDRRRIIRALEIAFLSGRKPSGLGRRKGGLEELGYQVRVVGIYRDRSELYERINARVRSMFRKEFIKEVKRLKKKGFSKTARQALGYREILEFTRHPERSEGSQDPSVPLGPQDDRLVPLIQQHTRQFSKRQLTWFRREKGIEWMEWAPGESARNVCDKIMSAYGER